MRHPLDWRRDVMEMTESGEVCSVCGWREEFDNPIDVHEAHMAHILHGEHKRLAARDEESNRYLQG
jgi:hypothetical protein